MNFKKFTKGFLIMSLFAMMPIGLAACNNDSPVEASSSNVVESSKDESNSNSESSNPNDESSAQESESENSESSGEELSTHTLAFITNGGSRVYSKQVMAGDTYDLTKAKTTKNGYTLVGWFIDEACEVPFDGVMPNYDLTVYAKWELKKVQFNLHLNSAETEDYTAELTYSEKFDIETPTKENADFIGWYFDEECSMTQKAEIDTVPNSGCDLYALWKLHAGTYYVSPNGTPTGKGTVNDPMDVRTACRFAGEGVNIVCLGGTYDLGARIVLPYSSSGTAANNAVLTAKDGEEVIFDFHRQLLADSNRGIQMCADYWTISNITVQSAGDNGILVGGSNNTIKNVVTRYNRDTGLQIARWNSTFQETIDTWPSNNLILNCTSYDNCDATGENADGYAAKLTVGYGNVFDGCIAYNNADDGWDLYAKNDTGSIGTVTIVNCIAFNNGELTVEGAKYMGKDSTRTPEGDGNGFKLGGSGIKGNVVVENCVAFGNFLHGFTDNSNPGTIVISHCTSFNNGKANGDKDNFNLARNANVANNCYYGLLSYSNDGTSSSINGDDFYGSMAYSIMRICEDSKNGPINTYAIGDYILGNSLNENARGTKQDKNYINDKTFKSLSLPTQSDLIMIHTLYRNADGSVNIGDLLSLADASLMTYCVEANGSKSAIGATLNKTSYSDYHHYQKTTSDPTVTSDKEVRAQIEDSLDSYKFCNFNGCYQDVQLFTKFKGYKATWTVSNTDLFTIEVPENNDVAFMGATLNRLNLEADTKVKFTVTIALSETDTIIKEFDVTVKKYIPGFGTLNGSLTVDNIVQGDAYTVPTFTFMDRNNRNATALSETQYTTDVKYYKNGVETTLDTNEVGEYTVKLTYTLNASGEETEVTYTLNVIAKDAPLTINSFEGDYIISDGINFKGNVSYKEGKVYIIAVPVGSQTPSSAQIKAMANYDNVTILGSEVVELSDYNFKGNIKLADNTTSCVLYAFADNGNVAKGSSVKVTSKIEAIKEISTIDQLYTMCTTQDATPTAYALVNDIDATGYKWTVPASQTYYFAGLLNGFGHTISNLTIEGSNSSSKVAFGMMRCVNGGEIKNIKFDNCNVKRTDTTQTSGTAILAGFFNAGKIYNLSFTNSNATAAEGVGLVAGTINGIAAGNGVVSIDRISVDSCVVNCTSRYGGLIVGGILGDDLPTSGSAAITAYMKINMSNILMTNSTITGLAGGTVAGQYLGGCVGRYKNDRGSSVLDIRNVYFFGTINAAKYGGGLSGGSDKGSGYTYLTNCVVMTTIETEHTENRSIVGRVADDAVVVQDNTISVGAYGTGKDSCTMNIGSSLTISNQSFWENNMHFDFTNYWKWDVSRLVLVFDEN